MFKKFLLFLFSGIICVFLSGQSHAGAKKLILDDFSSAKAGKGLPRTWDVKENKGKAIIEVVSENGNNVLHLTSKQTSFTMNKEFPVDLKKYPIISWRWKVTALPEGGDVRNKDKDDQAIQIYLHFAKFPKKVNFWELGYIWDTTAPAGSMLPSSQLIGSRVQYVVLQSGPAKLGQWVTERRNAYEDHKKLFGEEPPEMMGIGVMIDSDNTNSNSECYIDDIIFEQE